MERPKTYLSQLWRRERLLATWPPDRTLSPGQIVSRDDNGVVRVETTIEDVVRSAREILPSPNVVTGDASPIESFVSATFQADAHALAALAAVEITFSKQGGYALKADGGSIREFEALDPWRKLVNRLVGSARWEEHWQLVTHVRDYQRLTLVRANKGGQKVSVRTSVPADTVTGLGDITAGASALSMSSGFSAWGITTGATLGYEGLSVKRRLVRQSVIEPTELWHLESAPVLRLTAVTAEPDWNLDETE